MTGENATAPVWRDRGCETQRALDLRSAHNTDLPPEWQRRIPSPAEYFPIQVAGLSEPGHDGRAVGPCPLHPDSHRSLEVDLTGSQGGWRCGACGANGDLVDFHMQRNALTLELAVRDLVAMGKAMRSKRFFNTHSKLHSKLAYCKHLADHGTPLSSAELVAFERQKAEQRARDEGVWRIDGAG